MEDESRPVVAILADALVGGILVVDASVVSVGCPLSADGGRWDN